MGIWKETGAPVYTRIAVQNTIKSCELVGALIAQLMDMETVEDIPLVDNTKKFTHAMYLLTIGIDARVRRQGVASSLLQQCITYAETLPVSFNIL